MRTITRVLGLTLLAASVVCAADIERTVANNGNLVMENVPPIPASLVEDLNRWQNVRSGEFLDWSDEGGIYIATRFADVNQIHRVEMPGGARQQLTYEKDPVGAAVRRPGGSQLLFTRDKGGSEFTQIFLLDPDDGSTTMLTDGESRNGAILWDRRGQRFAYQSTRRNGASNDIWLMDADDPSSAELVLPAPDGTWWAGADFPDNGSRLLVTNYVSIADSRSLLLELDTGDVRLLAGGDPAPGVNLPVGFDADGEGFWLITDRGSEFRRLAWQSLAEGAAAEFVAADIDWGVEDAVLSHDRRRMAFVVNEDGLSRVYLLDTRSREYRAVSGIPTGIASRLRFSPDDRQLAMALNTPRSPSDSFVLELGQHPLQHGELTRWTTSEVGGLDPFAFRIPELVHYRSFDEVDGEARQIPAWIYKPTGDGPFPVVVSIHGGPEGQSRPGFNSTYQMWLEKLGVAVVLPNVRGSAGYGKSYLALDNGFRREDSVRDIGALLDWIGEQPDLDESRIAVFGGSYGGYMVLASAVHYSDRLRAAIDVVGISNFVTFLENTQDYRRDLRRAEYGDERDPPMRAHLQKISPLNNVERIAVPMLIVQGQNDPRVPVTESEQIVSALREQGQPVWYMNALNEGHGYKRKDNRDIYQQAVVMFLERHLVGGP